MHVFVSFTKHHPLVTFFAFAYVTSFAGFTLSFMYPSEWWILFIYGPFIGAIVVTAVTEGREGLKLWLRCIGCWRVGLWAYAAALLLPVLLQLVALTISLNLGVTMAHRAEWSAWRDILPQFILIFLLIALGEEPGFRGFALRRMLVGRSALAAGAFLGVLHAGWHLPLFVSGSEPLTIVPIILAGAVLLTWLYLLANGSVIPAMLMHATVNTTAGYFGSLLSTADLERHTTVLAGVYMLAALILVYITGPTLTRKRAQG